MATRKRFPLLAFHRILGGVAGLLLLYLGVSGAVVQGVDLAALLRHAPATDPDVVAMRESLDGPGNYAVIAAPDYAAPPLPTGLDAPAALARSFAAAGAGRAPVFWIELRMAGGSGVLAQALVAGHIQRFDVASASASATATASRLADPPMPPPGGPPASNHLAAKRWHRLWALGDGMLWLNALAGIALGGLVLAGLVLWARLYRARARIGRRALFWSAGGSLRGLHRGLAILAAAPLLVVAVSGTVLSVDSLMLAVYRLAHPEHLRFGMVPKGMVDDYSRPLAAAEIAPMATRGLAAFRSEQGARPIEALRLRVFAGMPQAVVIAGGAETEQLVYDTATGRRAGLSEPGYPDTVFPTGWAWHERWKRIHRGDILGLSGRWLSLFAGLSLAWFAGSGLWMYGAMWRRRRRAGRRALFWR